MPFCISLWELILLFFHQDTSRGGGGSNENRRSLAEFLGLDTRLTEPPATAPASARTNVSTLIFNRIRVVLNYFVGWFFHVLC